MNELKTVGTTLNVLFKSGIIITVILAFIITKYDPFEVFNQNTNSTSVDQMESWMTKSGYAVIHPAECSVTNAIDGIMIFKTQQAPAEYIEFEDAISARSCYNKVVDGLMSQYEANESTKMASNTNTFNLSCGSCCYYVKYIDNHVLYIWTKTGLFDEVSNLIRDIPF